MSNPDLINIFQQCLERLAAGEGVEACVRDFPQYADVLRSMLETSLVVQRLRVPLAETAEAQARLRPRIDEALETLTVRRIYPVRRLAALAASLLIVFFVVGGGVYAQGSLPGDTLYGLKLLTENVQLAVSGGSESLRQQFAERRVSEVRELLALERAETVIFRGELTIKDGTSWRVAGIDVQVNAGTPGAETVDIGDLTEVRGVTVNVVVAQEIRLIEAALPAVLTATPTVTPSATPTATPSCGIVPEGWVIYRVRSGDTLSFLSSSRGVTLEQVMAVNCLTNERRIIVGQALYLPPGASVVQPPSGDNLNPNPGSNNPSPPPGSSDDEDDDADD